MASVTFTAFFFLFTFLNTLLLAIPVTYDIPPSLEATKLATTSRYAALTKIKNPTHLYSLVLSSHSTIIRPTNQYAQHVIEVSFNNIPRYLLLDTGSADTWMISSHFQCLNSSLSAVPFPDCQFGDPYTGRDIMQIRNETYFQIYGTSEVLSGTFGYADVTIAGLTTEKQKIALVDSGYAIGDQVRSGVLGLAPRAVTRLFESMNMTNAPPNGSVTPYSPVFESMYSNINTSPDKIAPVFSIALERGDLGGYIAFGGLPPIDFTHDFAFTPFKGLNYYGRYDSGRYYPIEPHGFELDGVKEVTKYRAIVDSETAANRLPQDIADRVNAAFNPPATFYPSLQLYATACNATAPTFSLKIGDKEFMLHPKDMFLPFSYNGLCATSVTRGFEIDAEAYPKGFYVLGDAFLNGVVAIFDIGSNGMWFAVHDY